MTSRSTNPKKITIEAAHYAEILSRLDTLAKTTEELKNQILLRKHLDEDVVEMKKMLAGNGKPGFYGLRDIVMAWNSRINALTLLIVGNVLWAIVEKFL